MSRIVGVVFLLFFTGCPKKPKPVEVKPEPAPAPVEVPAPKWPAEYSSVPELGNIYFDFDKSDIRKDQIATLEANVKFLKENTDVVILIEGHCDERGTNEYNLALGQRRADAVRRYYKNAGISDDRISTVSYGEEKPVCLEHNEDCWQKNRRAETKIKGK